jgi:hypothetical protein
MSEGYEMTARKAAIRFDVHVAANTAVAMQTGSLLEQLT